jgi:hypothetical protein
LFPHIDRERDAVKARVSLCLGSQLSDRCDDILCTTFRLSERYLNAEQPCRDAIVGRIQSCGALQEMTGEHEVLEHRRAIGRILRGDPEVPDSEKERGPRITGKLRHMSPKQRKRRLALLWMLIQRLEERSLVYGRRVLFTPAR